MFLGIDIGTQSLKAVVIDRNLKLLGEGTRTYSPICPAPDRAEQDPAIWEKALGPAISDALEVAEAAPTEILSIGLAGQLDGCLPVNANGEPLGNCLIWMDRRASTCLESIDPEALHRLTGVISDPCHLAAKARWLKQNMPDARKIDLFHQPVSYMVERLTGTRVIDHALASTSMLYGLESRAYEASLLTAFEVSLRELPPIAEAHERAGRLNDVGSELTGLRKGIPVSVGTGDDFSTPLGAGVCQVDRISVAIGTGEVVSCLFDTAILDPGLLVETHAYPAGHYFVENPGWLSGGAVNWLMGVLGISQYRDFENIADLAPPGAEGLIFLPALTGAMAPEWHAGGRGCFYGITAKHGREHFARALLEGCGFAMRDVVERLIKLGAKPREINILGGGSRSQLWAQIRADLLNLPAAIASYPHSSPLGAALLGAVAAGEMPSLGAGCAALPKPSCLIEPVEAHAAALNQGYERYRLLFSSLKPLFGGQLQ